MLDSKSLISHGHSDKIPKVKMFALLVLALVASASANAIHSKCPEVKAVENFNLASYAQGKWYEIGSYPNPAYSNYKCGVVEYNLEGDIFKVKTSGVHNKKIESTEGSGKLAPNAGGSGILSVSQSYDESGKLSEHVYKILDVDYDNYVIGYYCNYDEQKKSYEDFAWVQSRSKNVSPEVVKKLENFFKESKVVDGSKFVWPEYSEKDCAVEA